MAWPQMIFFKENDIFKIIVGIFTYSINDIFN